MEKKQYSLTIEVLRRLEQAKLLKSMILIGSWSIYFYKYYFGSRKYVSFITTRDMDFLIPDPAKLMKKVSVISLVKDLGFIVDFKSREGYIKLVHPELTIEFLVPEKGKGSNRPVKIPQLGINAEPLRYLNFLAEHTITVSVGGMRLKLPHPVAFALHKFIIFKRRRKADKRDKDLEGAIRVFSQLIQANRHEEIRRIFKAMHKKWQKTVLRNLESVKETDIVNILK